MSVRHRGRYTAAHLFAGSGGGALGFKQAGFALAGAIDLDPRCAVDFEALLGQASVVADIETMTPAQLAKLIPRCPDVVFLSAPCDGFSGCQSAERSRSEKYQRLNRLALHGVRLVLMAWGRKQPRVILFENVSRITSRGADLLATLTLESAKAGYVVDQRTHNCGEIGGLGQSRPRFLLIARDPKTTLEPVRKPLKQPLRSIRSVIEEYPPPRPCDTGDPMHVLQELAELNWLRLACIIAGGDWRALPLQGVELVHCATEEIDRAIVADLAADAVVTAAVPWDPARHKGRPQCYGVADPDEPSITVRGRHEVQNCRASVADHRVATAIKPRRGRQNGGFGVNGPTRSAHTVVAADVANTWSSVADVRLSCSPRSGAYAAGDRPSHTVLGAHCVDNAQGTIADVRLTHATRRGAFEVQAADEPAKTVRGHHEVRQAPGAVEDRRIVYDPRGWPVASHVLVCRGDRFVLYGPARAWSSKIHTHLCIESRVSGDPQQPGAWHRPLTVRELAALQSFPSDFVFCGPRTTTGSGTGQVKRIGNAVPVAAARAIAGEVMAALVASDRRQLTLATSGVWVERRRRARAIAEVACQA